MPRTSCLIPDLRRNLCPDALLSNSARTTLVLPPCSCPTSPFNGNLPPPLLVSLSLPHELRPSPVQHPPRDHPCLICAAVCPSPHALQLRCSSTHTSPTASSVRACSRSCPLARAARSSHPDAHRRRPLVTPPLDALPLDQPTTNGLSEFRLLQLLQQPPWVHQVVLCPLDRGVPQGVVLCPLDRRELCQNDAACAGQ